MSEAVYTDRRIPGEIWQRVPGLATEKARQPHFSTGGMTRHCITVFEKTRATTQKT